ncbi:hypothetical protein [Helicobacter mustelae]|nr:hypothetical protein [Helicobacter mustelae]
MRILGISPTTTWALIGATCVGVIDTLWIPTRELVFWVLHGWDFA